MLAERFFSRLYRADRHLGGGGRRRRLHRPLPLEEAVTERKKEDFLKRPSRRRTQEPVRAKVVPATKSEVDKPVESAQLSEWLYLRPSRSWAKIEPSIGALDLRPYLFVAKDRKDFFGATTILGQLASIVEKLLGPKFAVQGLETELRQLAVRRGRAGP